MTLADLSPRTVGWAFRPVPPEPRSIAELIRAGTLDAELAATLWALIEGRAPIVVGAWHSGTGKTTLLNALLDFLPAGVWVRELAGAMESFDWLPQAPELGWKRHAGLVAGSRAATAAGVPRLAGSRDRGPTRPDTTVLHVQELSDHTPAYTWGAEARIAIRAMSIGYQLAATIHADRLEDVFEQLRRPPVHADDDELSRLGLVVILRHVGEGARRVTSAHYIRPVARDEHGHVQRLGPAVLATWDPSTDSFEHFGWGVLPELAARIGVRAGDLEIDIDRRRDYLQGLAQAGIVGIDDVRTALAGYRQTHAETAAASKGGTP